MEGGIRRNAVIQELTRSPHGDLKQYLDAGQQAAAQDPEFLAHLISWNRINGQIRDSHVALPVVYLHAQRSVDELRENALAHIGSLDPRNLVRAVRFAREIRALDHGVQLRKLVKNYLRARERVWPWWERAALQHRDSMKTLYALGHVKPSAMADLILFKRKPPKGTVFDVLKRLDGMSLNEAAGEILQRKLPFLVLMGALGKKAKDPAMLMALISRMSPTELVTNAKMLERLGVKDDPAARAAFEEALVRAAGSKKATFKTSRAVEAVDDEKLKKKLRAVQEKQIKQIGVDGNWLILADRSSSMQVGIETARHVAAGLVAAVKGQVHLIFFNTTPQHYDVTGKTFEEITALTKMMREGGMTSIGCGLHYALEKGYDIDGIAIVTDGQENQAPPFAGVYNRFVATTGKEVPVYCYLVGRVADVSYLDATMAQHGYSLETFDLRSGVDYYSLPNLVTTMRTNRYSLADEIMDVPLLTLEEVFKAKGAA